MNNYKLYSQCLNNIFRIDSSVLDSCGIIEFGDNCWGEIEGTSLNGNKIGGGVMGVKRIIFSSNGKYINSMLGINICRENFHGISDENEGIYVNLYNDNNDISVISNKDYVIGTIYYKNQSESNGYYFKFLDINMYLGKSLIIYDVKGDYLLIDDSKLPAKVKMSGITMNGIIQNGIGFIDKVKDSIEELIKEILEENGFKPTDEEINKIVKNSAFAYDKCMEKPYNIPYNEEVHNKLYSYYGKE